MLQKKAFAMAAIAIFIGFSLTSCGQSSQGQNSNQSQSSRWSSDSVLNQMIDLSILKEWGYYGDSDSDDLQVVDFRSKDQSASPRKLLSAKPDKCLPLAIFLEASSKTQADYLLIQNVSDRDLLPSKSMMFNLFTFSSSELAKKQFDGIKAIAGECGLYVAQFADENIDRDLWPRAEIEENSIRAYNAEYGEANSIQLVGDVIYSLWFSENENLSRSKETLGLAEEIIKAKILQKSS